jgi:hypothetical protein
MSWATTLAGAAMVVLVMGAVILIVQMVSALASRPKAPPKLTSSEIAGASTSPVSAPHLTDDQIRKQNEIALAAARAKASPSAKDDLDNPNHKFPDFTKRAKALDKLDAERTWTGVEQGSLAPIDPLCESRCRDYMESRLKDPGSAEYKFGQPRAAMLNEHILCWVIPAWINSKNGFGAYTGSEEFDFFIQGGENGDVITCFKPSLYTDKHGKIKVNNQQF